jgi:hypothetical protein
MPVELDKTFFIETPLVLFTEKISADSFDIPLGSDSILTETIAVPFKFARKIPEVTFSLVD